MGDAAESAAASGSDAFAAKDRLFGVGVVRDPHPRLRELYEQCPVHQGSISGVFGLVGPDNFLTPDDEQVSVFGFEAVDRGFRDPLTLSSAYYRPLLGAVIGRTILEMDPPEQPAFPHAAPGRVQQEGDGPLGARLRARHRRPSARRAGVPRSR